MKPTTPNIVTKNSERQSVRTFPVTDYHYQSSLSMEGFAGGPCAETRQLGFHKISSDYFKNEDGNYFLAEAAVFGAIFAMAALPLISGATAVLALVHNLPGI